jgi:hypothetical protein
MAYYQGHQIGAYYKGRRLGAFYKGVEVLMPRLDDFVLNPTSLFFKAQNSGSDVAKTIEGRPVHFRREPFVVSGVPTWLSVDLVVNGDIATITVYPTSNNTSTSDRTATITITDAIEDVDTFTVTQEKNVPITGINPDSHTWKWNDGSSSSIEITIQGGIPGFIPSNVPAWLDISVSYNVFTVYPTSNNTSTERNRIGTITFTDANGNTVTFKATQWADAPLEASSTSMTWEWNESGSSVGKTSTLKGGRGTISISGTPTWLSATLTNGVVTAYPVSQNTGTSERTGTITLTDEQGKTATITVTQKVIRNIFVAAGNNIIMYTDDGGATWI